MPSWDRFLPKVYGKVEAGDYILPSGFHNGAGVARSPERMEAKDYKDILGIAWERFDGEGIGYINTAIGLNSNDMADLVQQQEQQINALVAQMEQNNRILADLVPGFAEAANIMTHDHDHAHTTENGAQLTDLEGSLVQPEADQIVYVEIEREHLEEGLKMAYEITLKTYEQAGMDINEHPFWNRIKSDQDL